MNFDCFVSGAIVLHCDTREKAEILMQECEKQNIEWQNCTKATDNTQWDIYKEKYLL